MVFVSIQYLRALAALLVVVVHSSEVLRLLGMSGALTEAASVGVDLFFVISGFIMVHNTNQKPIEPLGFLLNRITRVAPLYWLLTTFVFAIALTFPKLLGGTDADTLDFLKSLLFIPYERGDGTIRPMLFVGWSLNYEIFFYLIFAAALCFKSRTTRLVVPLLVLILLVLLGEILRPVGPEARFLTRPIILEFGLGMLLAEIFPRLPTSKRAGYVATGLLVVALVLLLPSAAIDGTRYPIAALPSVLIVGAALVLERAGLVPVCPWAILIGNASYSLYLTHPFVAQAITKVAQKLSVLTPATAPFILGLIFVSASITAILVWRYIEKPLGRTAKRLLDAPRMRPLSSPPAR